MKDCSLQSAASEAIGNWNQIARLLCMYVRHPGTRALKLHKAQLKAPGDPGEPSVLWELLSLLLCRCAIADSMGCYLQFSDQQGADCPLQR